MNTLNPWVVAALIGDPVEIEDLVNPQTRGADAAEVFARLSQRWPSPSMSFQVWKESGERLQEQLFKHGIRVTFPYEDDYPLCFYGLSSPPLTWTYQGEPAWFRRNRLAVVGGREPLRDTHEWLSSHFVEFCRDREWVVVSGAARGVDQLAHLAALKTGSPTIAVLPSGLMKIYPSDFARWRDAIIGCGGCVVSQFPLKTEMRKYHFHWRNRLIAALSPGLFVAEANRRSGSRMTADYALRLGREIATLPVSSMGGKGLGGLDLLFDGAQLLRNVEDLKLWCALLPKPPVQGKGHSHSKLQHRVGLHPASPPLPQGCKATNRRQ